MAQLPNVYSLLGQATTSEYNRRRKEERKYIKDIERDRLKASLLGMVLNPLAQSITSGISQGIANKFGNKYENWVASTEEMWQYNRDVKKGEENFIKLQELDKKVADSGLTSQEYFHQKVAPTFMGEQMDEVLQQKYKNHLANKESVFNKGILAALSRERHSKGDTAAYDAWVSRLDAFRSNEIKDPGQLAAFERLAKKQFPTTMLGTAWNWMKGKSSDEIEATSLQLQNKNPVIQSLRRLDNLNDTYAKEKVVDFEELDLLLKESEQAELFKKKNQTTLEIKTVYDEEQKVISKLRKEKFTYPFGKLDKEGNILTEEIIEKEDKLDTIEKLRSDIEESLRTGNSFFTRWKTLNEQGRRLFNEAVGGKAAAQKILTAAQNNWLTPPTYDEKGELISEGGMVPLEEIMKRNFQLSGVLIEDGMISKDLDRATQLALQSEARFKMHLKTVDVYFEDARTAVEAGDYTSIFDALLDEKTELGKNFADWQREYANLNNLTKQQGLNQAQLRLLQIEQDPKGQRFN